MFKKIFNKLKKRSLLSTIYERFIKGLLSLYFFKFIFNKRFIFNKKIKCWGSISIRVHENSKVVIGENCKIVSNINRAGITIFSKFKITALFNSQINIGDNISFNGTSISCRTTKIDIGDNTIIAPNVIIVDSDFHSLSPNQARENNLDYESDKPVFIGKNVWIGMNVIVLKGVSIGDNTVIAAGSIVTKSLPSNIIAAGNPAEKIRSLI
jgi:acetyltransferase-like isoleucine patch superfamily enzyme